MDPPTPVEVPRRGVATITTVDSGDAGDKGDAEDTRDTVLRTPAMRPEPVPPSVEPPAAGWVPLVGRLAAASLLAVLPIMVLAFRAESSVDGWNLFAIISPIEAVLAAVAVWLLVGALARRRLSTAVGAGALTVIGALCSVGSLGLVKFSAQRIDPGAVVLSVLAVLGATATLAVGVSCARASIGTARHGRIDPAALMLGLVGAGLAVAALLQPYDGFSSLASELGEGGYSAEFFFEPALAVVLVLVGLSA